MKLPSKNFEAAGHRSWRWRPCARKMGWRCGGSVGWLVGSHWLQQSYSFFNTYILFVSHCCCATLMGVRDWTVPSSITIFFSHIRLLVSVAWYCVASCRSAPDRASTPIPIRYEMHLCVCRWGVWFWLNNFGYVRPNWGGGHQDADLPHKLSGRTELSWMGQGASDW